MVAGIPRIPTMLTWIKLREADVKMEACLPEAGWGTLLGWVPYGEGERHRVE